jgi:hypothetical protein
MARTERLPQILKICELARFSSGLLICKSVFQSTLGLG